MATLPYTYHRRCHMLDLQGDMAREGGLTYPRLPWRTIAPCGDDGGWKLMRDDEGTVQVRPGVVPQLCFGTGAARGPPGRPVSLSAYTCTHVNVLPTRTSPNEYHRNPDTRLLCNFPGWGWDYCLHLARFHMHRIPTSLPSTTTHAYFLLSELKSPF